MAGQKGENLKKWFMKNLILPNNEIIDKPGYIANLQLGQKSGKIYMREVFVPETYMADVEDAFIERYGVEGKRALYEAGKRWGILFDEVVRAPTKKQMSAEEFRGFVDTLIKYLKSEYASDMSYSLDMDNDTLELISKDLLICSKNGKGYFLLGALTGAWSFITCRDDVEGAQRACQGQGSPECVMVCAPKGSLRPGEYFRVERSETMSVERYAFLNKLRKLDYAKNSLLDLLTARIVTYEGGFFRLGNERLVFNECSFIYVLESVLARLEGGEELFFKVTFDYFKRFGRKMKISRKGITDLLPALGWGGILVGSDNSSVLCESHPWAGAGVRSRFVMFRGMLSGLVSSYSGRDVFYRRANTSISQGVMDMRLEA
ncbi:MAG: hypothetical protein AB1529_07280 [Candidatus Micrarchaeota archaeon]